MVKKRFLILSSYTLPETSGSGIHAHSFAEHLNNSNHTAKILSFNRNLAFNTTETIRGVLIERIPYFNKSIFLKILCLPIVLLYFLKNIPASDIIVIYGNKLAGFKMLLVLSWLFKKKIIFRSTLIDVDDYKTNCGKSWLNQIFNKPFYQIPNTYFSINKEFSKRFYLSKIHKTSLFQSVQGVNTVSFKTIPNDEKIKLRAKLNLPENQRIIICPGLLIKRKGFDELFFELSKLDLDFLLLVVGLNDPPENHFLIRKKSEMNELRKLGERLLGCKIRFLGHKNNVKEYLQASDLFILNSKAEGLPNVLLEAMAVGLPIVIRKLNGLNEFVTFDKVNCLIFENAWEIPELIALLINNPQLAKTLGSEAARMAESEFSFSVVTKKLLQHLFQSTLD